MRAPAKPFFLSFFLVALLPVACASGEEMKERPSLDDVNPSGSPDGGTTDAKSGGKDAALEAGPTDAGDVSDAADATTKPSEPEEGDVIFVELHVNPALTVSDDAGEFVELYNTTEHPLELQGCRLDDSGINGDVYTLTKSIVVPQHSIVVLAKLVAPADNGGVPGVAEGFGTAFSLDNGGGTVSLVCGGVTIDKVAFTTAWPFAENVAMQLAKSAFTAAKNDKRESWCAAPTVYANGQKGSPGTTADHCP